jgi:phosphate-selective porin OprO/OprP
MDSAEKTERLEKRVTEMEAAANGYLKEPWTFRAYWKDSLRFETQDKEFQIRFFGRINNDWTWQSADEPTENAIRNGLGQDSAFVDGTEFRRARLGISGEIYERTIFKAEWDWAGGDSTFRDVYAGVKKIPYIGQLTVGHQREPFGLEELASGNDTTFLERSPVFAPSRNTGVEIRNTAFEERIQWQAAVHRETDDFGDSSDGVNTVTSDDGEYQLTGRITGLPCYEEQGRKLLHLGLAASRRSPHENRQRYRERPPVHQTTRFIDTGFRDRFGFDVIYDKIYLFGTEGLLIYGPFSLQAEWSLAHNDRKNRENFNLPFNAGEPDDDVDFRAWYLYTSYVVTGENRVYKTAEGTFSSITPEDNFWDKKTGWGLGAWEMALRYSDIDLEDASVIGGEMDDITLGFNWYLNKNSRVMFNYILVDLERKLFYNDPPGSNRIKDFYDGDYDALTLRFQVYW